MWASSKALLFPFYLDVKEAREIPYTISYIIKKMIQIDNLNQLPEEKRPPDNILWHNNPDKLTEWLDKVLNRKEKKEINQDVVRLPIFEVE